LEYVIGRFLACLDLEGRLALLDRSLDGRLAGQPDLSRATGINAAHLGRIENGRRPPTESLALKCDAAFPERGGWFTDWYRESRTWQEVPAPASGQPWSSRCSGTASRPCCCG
jgi:hypothetical protein